MTDYASSVTTAKPSWTWWMTTAAAAAIRMRNLRDHHGGDGGHKDYNDVDDEFAESDRKRQRCFSNEEFWMIGAETHDPNKNGSQGHDSITVGPLDLSVKATVTTAADVINGRMMNNSSRRDEHVAKTPVKRSTITNSRSSKKLTGKMTGSSVTTAATVKAATRKLLPQLLLDHHVDRSSPVSGTIIVPAKPDQGQSTCRLMSPSSPYITATDFVDSDRPDDDYDGGDIDPEFNVVVATDEARRRLESIPNALGPYRCRLCSVRFVDAFALARHRCRCIVHVRYRCPECDKVFQCPANLASHRRWHGTGTKSSSGGINNTNNINNGRNKGTTENVGNEQEQQMTTNNNDDDDDKNNGDREVDSGETTATTPATSTAAVTMNVTGFKKNILQRAVQAAAAAAIATHENIGVTKNIS